MMIRVREWAQVSACGKTRHEILPFEDVERNILPNENMRSVDGNVYALNNLRINNIKTLLCHIPILTA